MTFSVVWKNQARKEFIRLEGAVQLRILRVITNLEANPRPPGAKKLEGHPDIWRIRSGDYRVIYTIEDDRLVVLVVKIGHRREVYR